LSAHSEIEQTIRQIIGELNDAGVIALGPTAIAMRTYDVYSHPDDDVHVRYASVEHFKQMSRSVLAKQYDPEDGDESEAYQGDMFSGHLQTRYPIPRKRDDEPIYKPREVLTTSELDWNIAQLEKSAHARLRHADALRLYRDQRAAA
jgi:hypothetical protein